MMTCCLAAGHRREKGDFIAVTNRMVTPDVLVVDGDEDIRGHGKVSHDRPHVAYALDRVARNAAFGLAHAFAQAGKEFHLDHGGFIKG